MGSGQIPPRAKAARIAREQGALRHVSMLVARAVPLEQLFAAVPVAVAKLVNADLTSLLRFEAGDTMTPLAGWNAPDLMAPGGLPRSLDDELRMVRDTGCTSRFDSGTLTGALTGPRAPVDAVRILGVRSSVVVPIVLGAQTWGATVAACERSEPFSDDSASLMSEVNALVALALANAESRVQLQAIAAEQSALRRIAELVAADSGSSEVFDAVTMEAHQLCGGHFTTLLRYEADGQAVIVSMQGADAVRHVMHVGMRLARDGDGVAQRVWATGHSFRFDSYDDVPGRNAATARELGLTSGIGAPIIAAGRVWGAITVLADHLTLRAATQARLESFARLAATAITNARARAELTSLVELQVGLRRVAELVAQGVSQPELLAAVATGASALTERGVVLARLDADPTFTVVAGHDAPIDLDLEISTTVEDHRVLRRALSGPRSTPRPDLSAIVTRIFQKAYGITTTSLPIIVNDRLWGALAALGAERAELAGDRQRLEQFAELVTVALANSQAQQEIRQLAHEQTALRKVAELVARAVPQQEIFDAVAAEAADLLNGQPMTLSRFLGGDELVVVAVHGGPAPLGARIRFEPKTLPDRVRRRGRMVRVDDYTVQRDADLAVRFGLGAAVAAPIKLGGAVWGMLTATSGSAPLPVGTEYRLNMFAELVAAAVANSEAGADLQRVADEQAALRRIAELAARETLGDEVLEAVVAETSRLTGVRFVNLLRFDPGGSSVIVAVVGAPDGIVVGMRDTDGGDGPVQRVWRTGRPARVEGPVTAGSGWQQVAHRFGFSTIVAVPVLVRTKPWGVLVAVGDPLPQGIEDQLTRFAELAGTAVSAVRARRDRQVLVDEHSAFRRVAELVARGEPLENVFVAVATEASRLLGDLTAALLRYGPGQDAVVVAVSGSPAVVGLRGRVSGGLEIVLRTGRPTTISADNSARTELTDRLGIGTGIVVPVIVEGRVWGVLATDRPETSASKESLERLTQFADLAAAAIANAENKANLRASRARVVATADETRRQLQRDVHDTAQQRLVHTIISLNLARDVLDEADAAASLVEEALAHAVRASHDLREIVHGILPAALILGGLRAGVESLVADLALPVDVRVAAQRLPVKTETTSYFIVAEALNNVVKHAHATHADVDVTLNGDVVTVVVSDDGCGGAALVGGTGLIGLLDRVEAGGGQLTITSPRGMGTSLHATLPLEDAASSGE
ncbi:MAG: GAF domain-containing protein [Terracoccus sp.]